MCVVHRSSDRILRHVAMALLLCAVAASWAHCASGSSQPFLLEYSATTRRTDHSQPAVAERTFAEVRRTDASDALDTGTSRDSRSICLIGRFDAPYSRPIVTAKLIERGFDVRPSTEPVGVVLTGNDPINEECTGFVPVDSLRDYRSAVGRGARIVRLRDVRHALLP
jgi:hypothetical protein